jgi:hypothetical protein
VEKSRQLTHAQVKFKVVQEIDGILVRSKCVVEQTNG